MKARAFSNATTADLWLALDAASGRRGERSRRRLDRATRFSARDRRSPVRRVGHRIVTLAQKRFLLEGEDPRHSHWRVPMRVRAGAAAVPEPLLLAGMAREWKQAVRPTAEPHAGIDRLLPCRL